MPELPELEVIREVLERRVADRTVVKVEVLPPGGPIVVRDLTQTGFEAALVNTKLAAITRRGKFLVCSLHSSDSSLYLVLNFKLTGRLQLAEPGLRRTAKTHVVLSLSGDIQLRYLDQKKMGQLYLTRDPMSIQEYANLGPEPFEVSLEEFQSRIKPFRGEIKGILTRGEFIAGIGNAYADEILWAAKLHPYRKRTQLSSDDIEHLYMAMRSTLEDAVASVRSRMQENIEQEPRDFMSVHMKTGQPCPRCGTPISMVGANQTITNFCRTCQPGGLIKGMS